jgi:DNA mismatch endonuclease (patch repair protein)
VFVNGCFWHGHGGCKYSKLPETNLEFWKHKIEGNAAHDIEVRTQLQQSGWQVVTIWQCQLKPDVREQTFTELLKSLSNEG